MTEPGTEEIASIVNPARLNRFMSSPRWTEEQWEAAIDVIEGVESTLASKLNTYILPVPYAETVTVLRSGQVNTTHPVSSVTKLNGAAITSDALPAGWTMREQRLHTTLYPPPGFGEPFTLDTWGLGTRMGEVDRVDGLGACSIEYLAGWGNVPALRLAILKKARVIFRNQHDDSITVRDLNADIGPTSRTHESEEWTEEDLKDLERFRNLTGWR